MDEYFKRKSFDFTSIAVTILNDAVILKKRILFIGGKNDESIDFVFNIKSLYPNLDFLHIDGYRENEYYISKLKSVRPDIVIIGQGSPIQEKNLYIWNCNYIRREKKSC